MAYIIPKTSRNKVYFHLVEAYRDHRNCVKHRRIAYLGHWNSVDGALKSYRLELERLERKQETDRWILEQVGEHPELIKAVGRQWFRQAQNAPKRLAWLERQIEKLRPFEGLGIERPLVPDDHVWDLSGDIDIDVDINGDPLADTDIDDPDDEFIDDEWVDGDVPDDLLWVSS